MVEIVGKYELRGSYLLDGREGSQVGEVSLCSDGKLVGIVRDSNSSLDSKNPNYGKDKLLLGLHFPLRDSVGFLKLVPYNSHIVPVIWYANAKVPSAVRDELRENYIGYYQFAMIWTPADDFQRILDCGMPPIEEVLELDAESLRFVYFNDEKIGFISSSGEEMGQKGQIEFKRI